MAVRRALFTKPAWAAKSPEPIESSQSTSIFQQNVYEDILQERRRKEERKAAKEKEREQQRRRRESESRDTRSDEDRTVKKRRVSKGPIELREDENEDDNFDEPGSASDSDRGSTRSEHSHRQKTPAIQAGPDKPSSRSTRATAKVQPDESKKDTISRSEEQAITVVDDDDDDLVIYEPSAPATKPPPARTNPKSKPRPPPPPAPELDSDSEEDEYLKTLKRKAREEVRAKSLQSTTRNADAPTPPTHNSFNPNPDPDLTTTPSEPQVHLYIQTLIPQCPPMGIIRRPSQTLESVRNHFCDTYKLNDALRSELFFTWNNQRLFNSTTTRSILEQIKRKHGTDKSGGNIVLEAVTDAIWNFRQQQRERARKRAEEGNDDDDANENENENGDGGTNDQDLSRPNNTTTTTDTNTNAPTTAPSSPGVILKLTSATPDLPSMNLRVHAHTPIDKIVRGYKRRMNVDMAKEVYLVFEGERLKGDQTVGDVGFENDDCVDVRCK